MDPQIPGTGTSATPPATTNPPAPEALPLQVTGLNRLISESEANPRQVDNRPEDQSSSTPRSEPIEDKDVAEVAPQTWYGRIYDNLKCNLGLATVTTADPEGKLLPAAESQSNPTGQTQDLASRNVGTIGGYITGAFSTVGNVLSKGASAIGTAFNKGSSMIDNAISSGSRSLVSSQAGVDFDLKDEEWQNVLNLVLHSVTGSDMVPDYKDYAIPKITKKNKSGLPLTVRNVTLNARPTPVNLSSASVGKQETIRSIDIRQLNCDVELPRPGQQPLLLNVSLLNGKATIGTDLVKVISTASASELGDIIDKGGKKVALKEDSTSIEVTAEKLAVEFRQLGARVRFSDNQPPQKDKACVTGFDTGKVTLHNVRLGRPINILRASPDQSTYVGFSGIHFENSADLPPLLGVESVDLKNFDRQHNGSFACKLKLHLDQLTQNRVLSFLARRFVGTSMELDIDVPVIKGEMSIADFKKGIAIRGSTRLLRWLIKAVLANPKTCITCSESGQPQLQVSIPKGVLRHFSFIKHLAIRYNIPLLKASPSLSVKIPLPLKGIFATSSQGKVVLSELIGGIGDSLSGTAAMPGALHITPTELEDMALEAEKGSLPQCLRLLDQARELLTEGHYNEASRALKAIPAEQYVAIINQSDQDARSFIHQAAHLLAPMESRKANQIYVELLRAHYPQEHFEESNDPRWLVKMAETIKPDSKENRTLLVDVLEMACKMDPHCGALLQLTKLIPDYYPAASLVSLMGKLIPTTHFSNPLTLASTVTILEHTLGDKITPLLEQYPTEPLIALVKARHLNARTHLNTLIQCLERHGLFTQAADIHLALGDTATARIVMDRAIEKGNGIAFTRRKQADLDNINRTPSKAVEVAKSLLGIWGEKKQSESIQQSARVLLIDLWDQAHEMGIGPELLTEPAVDPETSPYRSMVLRLFNISPQECDNPATLDTVLDTMREQLDKAETHAATLPGEKRLIPVYRQLLDDLQERNNDALFQDAEDQGTYEEEILETVNEASIDLPPPPVFMESTPATKSFIPGSLSQEQPAVEPETPSFELTPWEQEFFAHPPEQSSVSEVSTSLIEEKDEDDDDEFFTPELELEAPGVVKEVLETAPVTETSAVKEESRVIKQEHLASGNAPALPSMSFIRLQQEEPVGQSRLQPESNSFTSRQPIHSGLRRRRR